MRTPVTLLVLSLCAVSVALAVEGDATDRSLPDALQLVQEINDRDDGEVQRQRLVMTLTDSRGRSEQRVVESRRKDLDSERRSLVVFVEPPRYRGTAFLTWDYPVSGAEDDQWLYLPAMRKERRISASDRGSSFLGTDFTYEEIKNGAKVTIEDYRWRTLGRDTEAGRDCWRVEGVALDEQLARELRHHRIVLWIDPEVDFALRTDYFDRQGTHQRTVRVSEIRPVDGVLTAHRFEAVDHKSGHTTLIEVDEVDYGSAIEDRSLTQAALRRGLP